MREKLAAIDIEAIATQGHFRLAPKSIDKFLALIAEEVRDIENPYARYNPIDVHLEVKIFELCRQKVLGLLEGK